MSTLRHTPSARTIVLCMAAAMALSFFLGYAVDEEEIALGLFIVTSVAYWILVLHVPWKRRAYVLALSAMPLLGLSYSHLIAANGHLPSLFHYIAWPYHAFFLAGFYSAVAAIKKIEPDEPHLLQIILLPLALLFWFYGSMLILGDWL